MFGLLSCVTDLKVFMQKIEGGIVILTIYVDDLVNGNDEANIQATKDYSQ